MAETKKVIEIKKRKLKEELSRENPREEIVRRLKNSINRHRKWERKNKQRKQRRKRREN